MNEILVEGLEETDFRFLLTLLKENTTFTCGEKDKFVQAQAVLNKIKDIVDYLDNH